MSRVPKLAKTSGRWVDAGDVRVGDQLLLRDGRILPVEAIQHRSFRDKVYNFHVADLQCYAVGLSGVLVHNTNGKAQLIKQLTRLSNTWKSLMVRIANVDPADTAAVRELNEEKAGLEALIDTLLQQLSSGS